MSDTLAVAATAPPRPRRDTSPATLARRKTAAARRLPRLAADLAYCAELLAAGIPPEKPRQRRAS
jgi:hypothetical protein